MDGTKNTEHLISKNSSVEVSSRGSIYAGENDGDNRSGFHVPENAVDVDNELYEPDWFSESIDRIKWFRVKTRPSLSLVIGLTFIYSLSVSIASASMLQLIFELVCRDGKRINPDYKCSDADSQKAISELQTVSMFGANLISALVSGKLGELSDHYGRKPILIITISFSLISKLMEINLISPNQQVFHKSLLIFAEFTANIGGGTIVCICMINSYVSDIVDDKSRVYSMGLVGASSSIAIALAPQMGNLMLKITNSKMSVIYAEPTICLIALLYIMFLLPESRSLLERRKSINDFKQSRESRLSSADGDNKWSLSSSRFFHVINFFSPFRLFWLDKYEEDGVTVNYQRRINFLLILVFECCTVVAIFVFASISVLYGTYVFHWDAISMNYYLTLEMASRSVVLLVITPILLKFVRKFYTSSGKHLDMVDLIIVRVAISIEVIGDFFFIIATSSKSLALGSILISFGSLHTPTIKSAIIKYTPPGKVGEMLGAVSLLNNLVALVAPSLLMSLYSKTVETNPRTVFCIAGGLSSIALISSLLMRPVSEEVIAFDQERDANIGILSEDPTL
ncbi:hypothetical protein PACTADRAFT_49818 [Pachysolen tannophilus NRRL Y-2460]|uniref:Major facilitator superfamily (MFS) profile domain-containing protein n=1 Tax=Pachysolen tannophilus NRRL Y-2460 TaxID=669874 RepID=A0A1E4TXK2_PACTA|nr:hypothetical protein PACTADRAFT_49818 [Pachysolen tannophilus NRRL Y-2460]